MAQYLPLIEIMILINLVLLVAGFYRPWLVLWFMHKQNRLLVLQIYGISFMTLLLLRMVILYFFADQSI